MPLGVVGEHGRDLRAMGHIKTDGKTERFVGRCGVEELRHRLAHDRRDDVRLGVVIGRGAGRVMILWQELRPAVVSPPEIELLGCLAFEGVILHAELADEASEVAAFAQQRRVGALPLLLGEVIRGAEAHSMQALRHASEIRDPARRANRRGDVGVLEAHRVPHQRIEMRCLHKGMAHRAEGVVTLVVGEEEDDVRAG